MTQRGERRPPLRPVDGIVLLDKPLGLSSNDALQRVKRLFRAEKAGHTGSLDPLATGLLPICLGEATKLCGLLLEGDKHYRARVHVGASTTTGDAEGDIEHRSDCSSLDRSALLDAIEHFQGDIEQIPPMYSALKHQGRALYELAREGQTVAREPRRVTIRRLALLEARQDEIVIEVLCSKGTYIRTLAEDLLASVGQRAHLLELRRLGAAPFSDPAGMFTLDRLGELAELGMQSLDEILLPPVAGIADWPRVPADAPEIQRLNNGQRIRLQASAAHGRLAVLDLSGRLRFLGQVDAAGVFHPERLLHVRD